MANLNFTLVFVNHCEPIKIYSIVYNTIYEALAYEHININDIECMVICEEGRYYNYSGSDAIYIMMLKECGYE